MHQGVTRGVSEEYAAPVRRSPAAGHRLEARPSLVVHGFQRCRVQASQLVRSTPPGATPDNRPTAQPPGSASREAHCSVALRCAPPWGFQP